ncbi:hypothetical protein D1BOALGB6SA_8013 [Olavius sp. associated proteobacterium Delta 1]|nr:hypothetical protein D1BOALGB6SA_8013 [Olavius sp. associated proteobacterium Delta 1]
MAINSQHVTGFVAGIGVSALGFYLYKRNQSKVDAFLGNHGIQLSSPLEKDPQSMTLKELFLAKEELEDLIAEKEFDQKEGKKTKSKGSKETA